MPIAFMPLLRSALPALVLVLAAAPAAMADPAGQARTITVSGEGEVKAVPDQAELSAGVTSQDQSAAGALAANAEAMNAVFAALKAAGIAEKAIQTSNVSVSPQYSQEKLGSNQPPRIVGYQVSNNVSVTIENLAKLGATFDALVAAGANQLGGIALSIRDPAPLLKQARAAAIKDAIERAATYAAAAGVALGPIVAIGEAGSEPPQPIYHARMAMGGMVSTPIAAGEESVSANVTVVFEIH